MSSKIMGFMVLLLLTAVTGLFAQQAATILVDEQGIMRWSSNRQEVKGFGVNYSVPFAHAYRMAERGDVSHEEAIDKDVYHFARLGLDLYRIHVWDTEISDTLGNLLKNEHLRLFDYTISRMKERGIKFVITPIAYWGGGWPEPDPKTPGFAAKYGKGPSLTHPEAIKAQETYLYQFLNHVNRYTGLAYKDDPDVIAFEISNEPHHQGPQEQVTEFINRMVRSMRNTGTQKPIFYNMSHSIHLAEGYFDADIQGGTFQWYPTNLVAGHELQGNFLPNVDRYTIPFADNQKFKEMAKIVYEFDPADVGASYIYPAMARSFRTAGLQLAAQFAYDAAFMAPYNTEYGTHYMSLPYAPQKALSLKIASEVFHKVPLYKDYGSYPANTKFDDFRVDYEQDLAEMVSQEKFFYTNNTTSEPPAPRRLKEIAGWGNSPVVRYEGKGAYFLDHLEKGVWRLEVMPDAIWIRDPFAKASSEKKVAVLNWQEWPMQIQLPDLGEDYTVTALNDDNEHQPVLNRGSFTVRPGTYLLKKKGSRSRLNGESQWKNIRLKEFEAPSSSLERTYVQHQPLREATAGSSVQIEAEVVSPEAVGRVELVVYAGGQAEVLEMKRASGYTYSATLPAELNRPGFLHYYIVVQSGEGSRTYPADLQGHPYDWDFYEEKPYEVRVVAENAAVYLFDAITDTGELMWNWVRGAGLQPSAEPGKAQFVLRLDSIPVVNPASVEGEEVRDYSMRYTFKEQLAGRGQDIAAKSRLVFHGQSLEAKSLPLQIALVMKDGAAFGGIVTIDPEKGDYAIALDELEKVKLISLPRPYPGFLPYYFENTVTESLDLNAVESLQISIGPGIPAAEQYQAHGLAIESVRLE